MATTTAFDQASAAQAPALKVAILGFGTVGSAVARILCDQPAHSPLRLTHVFNRNVERKRVDWVADDVLWSSDVEQVLASDADIIVELVGGIDPAHDWVSRALASGKSVVTANKKLIAQHGPQLSALARQHGGALSFGASVAGGVPVIDALQEGLAGDRLYKVCGILNGTCNYILTKLEQRRRLLCGGARRSASAPALPKPIPPTMWMATTPAPSWSSSPASACKAIVQPEQIPCTSIRSVGAVDFTYAHELGCTIRQISRAERRDGQIYASVQPALVPIESPMAHITGSLNLVLSSGKYGGQTAFSGHGAGGHSTAVAVVSDLLAIARGRSGRTRASAFDGRSRCRSAETLPPSTTSASPCATVPALWRPLPTRWRRTASTLTRCCRSPALTRTRCPLWSRWSRVRPNNWRRRCAIFATSIFWFTLH